MASLDAMKMEIWVGKEAQHGITEPLRQRNRLTLVKRVVHMVLNLGHQKWHSVLAKKLGSLWQMAAREWLPFLINPTRA